MKWSRARLVRMMTLTVPCVWFFYVMFTVLTLETSFPPRHDPPLRRHGESKPEKKTLPPRVLAEAESDDAASLFRGELKRKTVENLEDHFRKMILERKASEKTKGTTNSTKYQREDTNLDDAHMVMHERRDGDEGKVTDGGIVKIGRGRGDVKDDVMKSVSDVDLYANVTFPPYVEDLPSGAEGQGPNGLLIVEESLTKDQQREYREKWDKNQFSQYVSDLIPVYRQLPDFRSESCRSVQYPFTLPRFSVVMVFYNEAWSTLLRSVHSILDRTSPQLLVEIILVDDCSSMDHLKKPLEKYFLDQPKVKIVRLPKRRGLIQARIRGFKVSTGEVVVFLDSHIECTAGWAEPLLWLVARDYRTVPFPVIDTIHAKKLTYMMNPFSPVGILDLSTFTFTWSATIKRRPRPVTGAKPSPTMPGGLFAISRKWFEELGTYDPELEYWGGENMELSLKTWMCGGSVVIADCSHVGHIFRAVNPVPWPRPLGHRNKVRVALVWMDRHAGHFLERINYQLGDYGDITDRLALRDRLKCHDFGWYVDNVFSELKEQLVFNATYAGEMRYEASGQCLDRISSTFPTGPWLMPCHHRGGHQFWYLREERYLQSGQKYLCQTGTGAVGLCFDKHPAREWTYNVTSGQLRHVTSGLCLQKKTSERKQADKSSDVMLAPCDPPSPRQRWTLQRRRQFKYTA